MKPRTTKLGVWVLSLVTPLTVWACGSTSRVPTSPSATTAPVGSSSEEAVAHPTTAPQHRVSGSGLIRQMPGLEYRNEIDARLLPDGTAVGHLTVNILDLSAFGFSKTYVVVNTIDCLEFDGQTVWFGGAIVETTAPGASQGDRTIGVITDTPDGDQAFSGPAQFYASPGTTCHDRPTLPKTPVVNGSFTVLPCADGRLVSG
jgi:hypothetical protein